MLSAIVGYMDPLAHHAELGGGFFQLAVQLRRLPAGASKEARERFWLEEMKRVFEVYGAERRRPKAARR